MLLMAARDDNTPDTILFYTGEVLAILGIGCAGVSIVKAMLVKCVWLRTWLW